MLRAILFDFDGVIVDSEPLHFGAFLDVFEPLGYRFDFGEYQRDIIGFDDRDATRFLLTERLGRSYAQAGELDAEAMTLIERKQQCFLDRVQRTPAPMIPGAAALIDALKGRVPIAIASGATREDIDAILAGLGRRDDFAVVVTADDVEKSKPHPQTYALAMERLSQHHGQPLAPAECLAIEDSPAGLRAAQAAGAQTLGVTTTHPAGDLALADRVVETLEGVTWERLIQWYSGG